MGAPFVEYLAFKISPNYDHQMIFSIVGDWMEDLQNPGMFLPKQNDFNTESFDGSLAEDKSVDRFRRNWSVF